MPRADWPADALALIDRLERQALEQHQEIKRLRGRLLEAEANMRAAIRAGVRSESELIELLHRGAKSAGQCDLCSGGTWSVPDSRCLTCWREDAEAALAARRGR